MKQRLPLVLSATALAVAVLGATPLGHAAESTVLKKVVPFAKKAGFATRAGLANRAKNASAVNGIKASATPTAGQLLPLGSNGRFPSSVIPSGPEGNTFWRLDGNRDLPTGAFLGTIDDDPLVFEVGGSTAMTIGRTGQIDVFNGLRADRLDANDNGSGCRVDDAAIDGCAGGVIEGGVEGDGQARGVTGVLNAATCPTSSAGVVGCGGGGIGMLGDSVTRGVVGTLERASCPGSYAVGGCAGPAPADGVLGSSAEGAGVRAVSTAGGTIFAGDAPLGTPKARIDGNGKGFFDGGTQTGGADYAESLRAVAGPKLEPGDVLAIDPRHGYEVGKSSGPSSPLVAGVYSTKPAVLAAGQHGMSASLAGRVPVAMLGIVPTKVSAENGAVRAGDLLTTARTPGYAMKARHAVTGTILGKALRPLPSGRGVIAVLVMLR
jgi:hypothetical protein